MPLVTLERHPPIRRVHFNNGKRNVLTPEAIAALTEALAPDAEAPVVILSGRPDGFSAGLDNATLAASAREREGLLAAMAELLVSTLLGPTRVVAICEGHAVAAGAMMLLVSDVRLGVPGSHKLGFTEPGLGMPLPELPALLARMRLDLRRLHELAVLGRIVGPQEAAECGFLDEVVAPEELERLALERAQALAALSEVGYQGLLRSVWGPTLGRLEESAVQARGTPR